MSIEIKEVAAITIDDWVDLLQIVEGLKDLLAENNSIDQYTLKAWDRLYTKWVSMK